MMHRLLLVGARRGGAVAGAARRWEASEAPREYFFYLNDHGNLYHLLDRAAFEAGGRGIPVGPAHLRDEKFLDFFFAMLRPNATGVHEAAFPYVSLCRGERNYLRPSDRPYVFKEIVTDAGNNATHLVYGGAARVDFDPTALCLCDEGRIYHPARKGEMGLLSCHCAMRLGLDSIWDDEAAGKAPFLLWRGEEYPLTMIPAFPPKFV
eukprot:TRINITY_DN16644_c0_g1_i1.p1 TRINITY_DN16644_c0_g1~~TRINITY_DN16644_c0_g1_i1.p1  ORF type:complete len:207 (+),score=61.71 TRINITY_DN16644_c0_g1_i1:315-935(+)